MKIWVIGVYQVYTACLLISFFKSKTSTVQNVSYHFHAVTTCIVGIYMLCMFLAYRFDFFFFFFATPNNTQKKISVKLDIKP